MAPRRVTAVLACLVVCVASAPPVLADPESDASPADGVPHFEAAATADPPADDGRVPSAEPATTTTPDGWTLRISSRDEMILPVPPLTTALSSRDYIVGGIFNGSLAGEGEPRGILEVGYQIGCGIDMGTSNGVTITGTAGITPSIGVIPELGLLPDVASPIAGGIAIGLKPGIVHIVPVAEKEFKGPEPWVMIANFHVQIDGCVGQSFIRSFVTLTHQTEQSDAVLSWLGVTKTV